MNRLVILLAMLTACSDTSGPVPLQDFDVSASLSTVPTTVVTENGRWEGCQTTWVFSTNDSHPTIYYSVGPATRNDTFQQSVVVSVPELGTVLGPGRYEYRWHVDAYNLTKGYSDFDRSFSDSVSCP